ncbi:MAG: DNA-binding protein [Streptosporangiales bacterium]|nr:DNA-binding protein [Streptosporangiales bacterium]
MKDYPRDPKIPDLVGVTEAAGMLGLTRQRVLAMLRGGVHLRGALVGSTWVIRRAEVRRRLGGKGK